MLHTIENEKLICKIESNGAEIRSLVNKKTGQEYIWQINPEIWGSSSPVLFPSIGKIKEEKILFKAKEYAMPKHGIIRNNNKLEFEQINATKCVFKLVSSEDTEKLYPFKFLFTIEFSLVNNCLRMTYHIENRDSIPMHFACGGHTAYSCPLDEITQLSDYVVEFPNVLAIEAGTLGEKGLLSATKRKFELKEKTLQLSNTLFNKDALIFSDIDFNWVRLRKKNKKKGVVVRFKDYPHLALWSKPAADYVCIEPWLGLPDAEDEATEITQKPSYKIIQPNNRFSITIETEIE